MRAHRLPQLRSVLHGRVRSVRTSNIAISISAVPVVPVTPAVCVEASQCAETAGSAGQGSFGLLLIVDACSGLVLTILHNYERVACATSTRCAVVDTGQPFCASCARRCRYNILMMNKRFGNRKQPNAEQQPHAHSSTQPFFLQYQYI